MNKLQNPYSTVIVKDNCATHRIHTFTCLFDDTAIVVLCIDPKCATTVGTCQMQYQEPPVKRLRVPAEMTCTLNVQIQSCQIDSYLYVAHASSP